MAIDGPAGAGKSTVARELARRLGFTIVDTGAIYRAVALAAQRAGLDWDDDAALAKLLDGPDFRLSFADDSRVLLNGDDVTAAIRTPEISRGASIVSARPVVRRSFMRTWTIRGACRYGSAACNAHPTRAVWCASDRTA